MVAGIGIAAIAGLAASLAFFYGKGTANPNAAGALPRSRPSVVEPPSNIEASIPLPPPAPPGVPAETSKPAVASSAGSPNLTKMERPPAAAAPATPKAPPIVEPVGLVRELKGHQGRVNSVAVAADGSLAFSGGQDASVRLWNVASGTATPEPQPRSSSDQRGDHTRRADRDLRLAGQDRANLEPASQSGPGRASARRTHRTRIRRGFRSGQSRRILG